MEGIRNIPLKEAGQWDILHVKVYWVGGMHVSPTERNCLVSDILKCINHPLGEELDSEQVP